MDRYQSCRQRADLGLEYKLLFTNEKHYNIRIRIITQMATFQVKVQTEKWWREETGYRQKKENESAVVNVIIF